MNFECRILHKNFESYSQKLKRGWKERKSKVKFATVVEGDQKAPFSIATTRRHGEGRNYFPWIAPLYPWYVTYIANVKQGGIKYHFKSLWYDTTWDWTQVSRTIGEHSTH